MKTAPTVDYASAGVSLDEAQRSVTRITQAVQSTHTPAVISNFGGFAAMLHLKEILEQYEDPVLVQSTDGIGTKSIVARMAKCYKNLGADLLSATANDIAVVGAKPLCLLDYYACGKLQSEVLGEIIDGLAHACRSHQVALTGGETAEMPQVLGEHEFDLAGTITGIVDHGTITDTSKVSDRDILIGLESSGLHTNGYSLARNICFEVAGWSIDKRFTENNTSLAELLLAPHINYTPAVLKCQEQSLTPRAMAHITGGGLQGNIERVLPDHLGAVIDPSSWPTPFIFELLCEKGKLTSSDAFAAFNMGIGWVLIVDPNDALAFENALSEFKPHRIGTVVPLAQKKSRVEIKTRFS